MVAQYATRNTLLACVPPDAVIAELGVFKGAFSDDLLTICEPRALHLIDRWTGPMECGDKDGQHIETLTHAEMQQVFVRLKQKYGRRQKDGHPVVFLHRLDVLTALASFDDDTFDLVYVDADHSYAAVKSHLEAAATKVKPGGLLGGHDYGAPYLGVVKAVDEFAAIRDFAWVAVTTGDGCPSFLLRRP
jgi:hypothetical protein